MGQREQRRMPGIKADLQHPAATGKRPQKRLPARATPRIRRRVVEVALLMKVAEITFQRFTGTGRNLI